MKPPPPRHRATAAVLALAAIVAGQSTTATAAARTVLTCHVATTADRPITFSPPLSTLTRPTRVTGTFRVTTCTSPDHSVNGLRSAVATMNGSGQAGCSGGSDITGTVTVVWYDAAGKRAGTSVVVPNQRSVNSYNPSDALLGGTVTRGPLAGTFMTGSATPTSDVTSCITRGLATVRGAGTVTFRR
ncbi:hypothetical protein [Streptomyces sp. NPDC091215]|uniref:hypothetical protein n=1 Tax=Streptomyces sp. NPDC091215 TaxID=3155192 RepID=UPI0034367F27